MIKGLEYLPCEAMLKHLWLFKLEKKKTKRRLDRHLQNYA